MNSKIGHFVFWTPRILAIAFIAFLTIFSFDVFGQGYGFWGTILAFLMHNIPVFILLIVLLISWKHEIVGAVVFILAGLLYVASLTISMIKNPPFHWYFLTWSLMIAGPAFLVGALFLIGWFKKSPKSG